MPKSNPLKRRRVWLANNGAAIADRLSWLHDQPDGLLHMEEAGSQAIMVTKVKFDIYLRLLETAKPDFLLVQSQLNLKSPFYLTPRYKQAMLLSLVWQSSPGRVCLVGLGGGRIPLILHHYLPDINLDCVDSDPAMLNVALKFFGLQPDDRLRVTIGDGQEFLKQFHHVYDIIFIDAFMANGQTPPHLTTAKFFRLCQKCLSTAGVVTINMLESDPGYAETVQAMQAVFDHVYACPFIEGNSVIFATQGFPRLSPAELVERARLIQDCHQFSFPFVKRATEVRIGPELLEQDSLLG
jgi:spermidine synthase